MDSPPPIVLKIYDRKSTSINNSNGWEAYNHHVSYFLACFRDISQSLKQVLEKAYIYKDKQIKIKGYHDDKRVEKERRV